MVTEICTRQSVAPKKNPHPACGTPLPFSKPKGRGETDSCLGQKGDGKDWDRCIDIPNSFIRIRNLYVSAEARSIEKQREAMGLDPRQWQTPKKKIFQQEALNRLCDAIANVDSTEVDKLLSREFDINEIGVDGLTVLFFAYMEGDFPSFVKLLEKGARPDIPISKELHVLPGRVAPQKGATILIFTPHIYGRYRYFERASKHIVAP